MKLSQPKTARLINTSRVLCELRKGENLSKAELSRVLDLNKVSTGEIVEALISQGLVAEGQKLDVSNGRRPTVLNIVEDARYVLCVDIGSRLVSVALCDLFGSVAKLERIPCNTSVPVEEFCASILKSCVRTCKLVDPSKILGAGITVAARISVDEKTILKCPYLPWDNLSLGDVFKTALGIETLICSSVNALVAAEKIYCPRLLVNSSPIFYLDWGDHIASAVITDDRVVCTNPDFGLFCIGDAYSKTLEEYCASWSIPGYSDGRMKNLWDNISEDSLEIMAKALKLSCQVVGANRVILGGESSSIEESALCRIKRECPNLAIEVSSLVEKANIRSAAEFTLDRFFYKSSVLDEIKPWI